MRGKKLITTLGNIRPDDRQQDKPNKAKTYSIRSPAKSQRSKRSPRRHQLDTLQAALPQKCITNSSIAIILSSYHPYHHISNQNLSLFFPPAISCSIFLSYASCSTVDKASPLIPLISKNGA